MLALVQEDGRTTSARYLGEDGEIRELPAEDVAAIEDSGVLNEAADPQQDSDAPVRALELSIGAYRMGASQAPSSAQDGAEKAPDGQAQASQAPAPSASPQDAQVKTQDRVVVTGLPAAQIERTTATIVTTVVLVSLAALAVIAAAGLWWVRRSLEPLRRISRSASDVARVAKAAGTPILPSDKTDFVFHGFGLVVGLAAAKALALALAVLSRNSARDSLPARGC